MTKLSGPLLSIEARGSLGPRLTYSTRKSGPQVRFQKAQSYAATAAQEIQRGFFQAAVGWWSELTTDEKSQWTWEGDNP